MIQWDCYEGLRTTFALSLQQMVSDLVDLTSMPPEDVRRVFEWARQDGDRLSQVAAVECGLRHIDVLPDIEPDLAAITRAVVEDDPSDAGGRLELTTSLVVLVEGEVARVGIARRQAPFWRRLATFAHAALLEREVLASGVGSSSLIEWALRGGGGLCGIQSTVDLRLEPRCGPQLIAPEQLRAEFLRRIAMAAERHREKVHGREIGALFWGVDSVFRPENLPPGSLLPGPLEGGLENALEYPPELESDLRGRLQGDEVSVSVLSGVVNSSLVFRPSRQLLAGAADALARVGWQVRELSDTATWFDW